ncbi:MAG: T9SS type A sorting domain-containing protein [Bacteroidota bacterium]
MNSNSNILKIQKSILGAVLVLFANLGFNSNAMAQEVTFAADIAPIIYNKCTNCHNPGGIKNDRPFTNYDEVKWSGPAIAGKVNTKEMPPWPPDPTYVHFLGERVLSDSQIALINTWVSNGMPRGDSALEPTPPPFTNEPLGTPDLVVSMAHKYTHTGDGRDAFRNFVIPSGLIGNHEVVAVEFVPGNPRIVHHVLIGLDTNGIGRILDARDQAYGYPSNGIDFSFNCADPTFGGFVPGTVVHRYPPGTGRKIYNNCDILLNVHYAPDDSVESDSSTVRIYFATTPAQRVITDVFLTQYNTGVAFILPPNAISTFHGVLTLPNQVSLIQVQPHCHWLGKSWNAYVTTPTGDTIKLLRINNWDFHWQGSFMFEKYKVIPAGSVLHAIAVYDNTTNNHHNPFNPPQWTSFGSSSFAEMMLLTIGFVPYNIGDEDISLETGEPIATGLKKVPPLLTAYPNPTKGRVEINYNLAAAGNGACEILDLNGRVIKALNADIQLHAGVNSYSADFTGLKAGIYLFRISTPDGNAVSKIIVSE